MAIAEEAPVSKYTVGPDIDLDEEVVLDRDGQRITEERAQQIAEETLDGVRRGQAVLDGAGHALSNVSFRVPDQLHRDAVAAAEVRWYVGICARSGSAGALPDR